MSSEQDSPTAQSAPAGARSAASGLSELARFHDVPITVSVLLDTKRMQFREIMKLKVGSVVKLVRSAGENVDLLLNGFAVGDGEVVVIDEMMGLRITDIRSDPSPDQDSGEE